MRSRASARFAAIVLSGTGWPICCIVFLKSSRSSALSIASRGVPKSRTPQRFSTPADASATAMFKPVWPPRVGSKPSGRSFSIMRVRKWGVNGSR